ncbi:copper amine oxidase [Gordoniibacillus kamchatkensis]|uniref:Copper amine oxidase n=1 Tax=Gordoniibacillus kamchatkensis TaxID=1590651 RepID=A0ABR5A702_9BACL|nr:copper amine oxidase N-terminal domain-containing protein [Paenibacillus sp. VKM B-2647]KIL36799.1 copper amine oxidase [Paenibacillus sp. VKM B-2647]
MNKKNGLWIMALLVAISLAPASALAKTGGTGGGSDVSGNSGSAGSGFGQEKKTNADAEATTQAGVRGNAQDNGSGHGLGHAAGDQTVTSATYGSEHGHNGYKGLLNAIDNVKDKPAGAVLADLLLTKYDTQLTDDMKQQLEAIKEKDQALSAAAEMLDEQGNVTDAVYMQREAVKANVKNIGLYKQLGKLYEKTGKTGVKLYVNGDEPAAEVAPFIRDGSTLVPFRAISEALKATVSWNAEERSVTVTRGDVTVKLLIDSKTAYVNGQQVELEVPAAIENGSTVVPVRFVSEALKAAVKWEPETQSVIVYEE